MFVAAFQQLVSGPVLAALMDLGLLTEVSKAEGKRIEASENKLKVLGELPGGGAGALKSRVRFLMEKVRGVQEKVEGWEREMAGLKVVLGKEF